VTIHPTAIITNGAEVSANADIGPHCVIGPYVQIGEGCRLHGHSYIQGRTKLGARNEIFPFVSIGYPPQDPKYRGELTETVIGTDNIFREGVTVNAGSASGRGVTTVGSRNLFMAYSHVGHDCAVGNHNMLVNNVSLAGHCVMGDHVILSGYVGVTQHVRIGSFSMVGAGCILSLDLPPFIRAKSKDNQRVKPQAINRVGLERNGFSAERIDRIDDAFRTFYIRGLTAKEAIEQIRATYVADQDVEAFVTFIELSERGVAR
jgi:UDP-N-acetylglucosamine acyltransferase